MLKALDAASSLALRFQHDMKHDSFGQTQCGGGVLPWSAPYMALLWVHYDLHSERLHMALQMAPGGIYYEVIGELEYSV